jgi:adenylate cyclase
MSTSFPTASRAATQLLIVFIDLTRFSAQSQRVDDTELADTIDAYYEKVARAIEGAGGRVVKFIGDATLAVFPESGASAGVESLLALKQSIDEMMIERGWECRLSAKIHFGTTMAGPFGPEGRKSFDIIGRAVNTAAVLETTGITLSVEAFRQLSSEVRQKFKKHSAPVTYIRHEDQRPGRRR